MSKKIIYSYTLSLGFLIFVLTNCTENDKVNTESLRFKEFEISKNFDTVLDSFTKLLKIRSKYINSVGYIRFNQSINNDTFKIYIQEIFNPNIVDTIHFDEYMKNDNVIFLVDYNASNIINFKSSMRELIIKQAGLNDNIKKKKIGLGDLQWLVRMVDGKVNKINKKARSIFGPPCPSCLEWGGFIDDEGIFHKN